MTRYTDYDAFAWFYNRYWGSTFAERVFPVVERLLLSHLPNKARLLDLCCGTGHLAAMLTERGFRVAGLDASAEMLEYARENAPSAKLILSDARDFQLPKRYHGALSTFDSLNHIMSQQELTRTFRNVYSALLDESLFLFDLNMEEAYQTNWQGSFAILQDDHVCAVRSDYDTEERVGRFEAALFRLQDDGWQRSDVRLSQRCYTEGEVRAALRVAGFAEVWVYNAERDLGMSGHRGRSFFLARKSPAR